MLLIVVRLNYMSALYFSSISFAAHKKHGVLRDPVGPGAELLHKYGLDVANIMATTKEFLA